MNPGKVTVYVLIGLLVLLILVIVVLAFIQIEDEHEFIKDVRKIKLQDHNELIGAGCYGYNKCHHKPTGGDKDNADNLCDLPIGVQALYILHKDPHVLKDACNNVDKNIINSIKTTFSFSYLEAKQIYNNNKLIIDNVYNNKDTKKCFRAFIQIVGPDLGNYFESKGEFTKNFDSDLTKFEDCYNRLDTRKQKYINIIIKV